MQHIIQAQAPGAFTRASTDQELLDRWIDRQTSPHTRRAYRRIAGRFLSELSRPLRAAGYEDFDRAVTAVCDRVQRRRSKDNYRQVCRSFLTFCHDIGYLPINPAPMLKRKHADTDEGVLAPDIHTRRVEVDEIHRLIDASDDISDRLIVEIGYYGGLRVSELVGIRCGQIRRLPDGTGQIAGLRGKGAKQRNVTLPPGVTERLLRYIAGRSPAAYVLASPRRSGSHVTTRYVQKRIKAMAEVAGVTALFSPHWLRHGHISHALDAGAPIHLVSTSVGHANIKTTSVYAEAGSSESSSTYLRERE